MSTIFNVTMTNIMSCEILKSFLINHLKIIKYNLNKILRWTEEYATLNFVRLSLLYEFMNAEPPSSFYLCKYLRGLWMSKKGA